MLPVQDQGVVYNVLGGLASAVSFSFSGNLSPSRDGPLYPGVGPILHCPNGGALLRWQECSGE